MAEGFLGRWAQRKQAVREGKPVEEPVAPAIRPEPCEGLVPPAERQLRQAQPERSESATAAPLAPAEPAPTLQDAQALTPQSDFQRFMAPDVDPEVRNVAMKKLFADPHFNVMDGMDVYIDDYNTPDPMPASMLRKLASAKFLRLFDEQENKDNSPPGADRAAGASPAPAANPAPGPAVPPSAPIAHDHDHTDLRLQQDHAAGPQGTGRGT